MVREGVRQPYGAVGSRLTTTFLKVVIGGASITRSARFVSNPSGSIRGPWGRRNFCGVLPLILSIGQMACSSF